MRPPSVPPARARALLRDARRLLDGASDDDDAWRSATPFAVLRRGDRNTVLRADIRAHGLDTGAAGRSVVLKLAGNDPDLADADLRYMLALTGTGVVPDVIAELGDARGFAMLDAGEETLARRLERGSPVDVPGSMRRVAQVYARLHVEGRAPLDRTESMRSATMTRELGRWMDGLPHALAWMRLPSEDARVRRGMTRICQAWYAGRDAMTLTHGDPAPGNVLFLDDGEARLVDFEYAAPRHPAYDVTAWDVLCPFPHDVVRGFREEYARARGALGWPVADGDGSYEAVIAYRALALLSWLPHSARKQDCAWVDQWSVRQAVLCTLDRLAARCMHDGELQRLAEAAADAAVAWRRAWPEVEEVLPSWPAFRAALA